MRAKLKRRDSELSAKSGGAHAGAAEGGKRDTCTEASVLPHQVEGVSAAAGEPPVQGERKKKKKEKKQRKAGRKEEEEEEEAARGVCEEAGDVSAWRAYALHPLLEGALGQMVSEKHCLL